jgi:hypothetical protein
VNVRGKFNLKIKDPNVAWDSSSFERANMPRLRFNLHRESPFRTQTNKQQQPREEMCQCERQAVSEMNAVTEWRSFSSALVTLTGKVFIIYLQRIFFFSFFFSLILHLHFNAPSEKAITLELAFITLDDDEKRAESGEKSLALA